jgi:hypothetical protein
VTPVQRPDTKDIQFVDGLRCYLKNIDERTVICGKKSNKTQLDTKASPWRFITSINEFLRSTHLRRPRWPGPFRAEGVTRFYVALPRRGILTTALIGL